jgi:hypothetical protein
LRKAHQVNHLAEGDVLSKQVPSGQRLYHRRGLYHWWWFFQSTRTDTDNESEDDTLDDDWAGMTVTKRKVMKPPTTRRRKQHPAEGVLVSDKDVVGPDAGMLWQTAARRRRRR